MDKIKLYILLLIAPIVMAACGDDDENSGYSGNENANTTAVNRYATRLEFPRLKGGKSLVVVHTVKTYGVNYAVEWDCEKKAQRWTCYQMYAANSAKNCSRSNEPFQEDKDLPAQYRTTLADYSGSGFDRGHICPSADRLNSREANEQTFYLSNMQPQWNKFNTGIWKKMEEKVRAWNRYDFRDTLFVCKGGTIDKASYIKQYTRSGLIVPRYFFMALLCKKNGRYKAMAFWVEHLNANHSNDNLKNYAISIDELEEHTGIDFFCNLPDNIERQVESSYTPSDWF